MKTARLGKIRKIVELGFTDSFLPRQQYLSEFSMNFRANLIFETVRAIAIGSFGNIAAGSSSGGAARKQKGRVGSAALVGTVKPGVWRPKSSESWWGVFMFKLNATSG